ncbi:Nif3-like dinuclear metal center hexameric protein [Sporohalobacter salinus]|uniref:Nif3-like dinuclear metal center hexameric protein n=1 Tax=Sporohalobacter salinus TaxID=1494606 RepID=UPI00195FBEC7|nr:Nif3-like dinuclear metal center hexameric protein [Sporohalobacter salinus]MBM7623199.1 dinuclear metal center YbgI/SA1388 family protein [Sporohalobacter salinus]
MSLSIQQVIQLMEEIAPKKLAQDWDNVGLQIGSYSQRVNKVLVTLDVNQKIMSEAAEKDVDLIISHHPVIFNSLSQVRFDTEIGNLVQTAVEEEISIYVAHTNYDIAQGGLNDQLSSKLGLTDLQVLKTTFEDELKKLVVFLPQENLEEVREAIIKQEVGWIGNYRDCTFAAEGVGTFRPLAGTDPYCGQQDQLEKADEVRLETILPESKVSQVLNKLESVHPYEEIAYDLYSVEATGEQLGLGRVGNLKRSLEFDKFVTQVKEALELDRVRTVKPDNSEIKRIAVCSGSGADLIRPAVFKGADLLVTGDIKYHDAELASEMGLGIIDAGHYGTEVIMQEGLVESLMAKIKQNGLEEIEIISTNRNKDFITIV